MVVDHDGHPASAIVYLQQDEYLKPAGKTQGVRAKAMFLKKYNTLSNPYKNILTGLLLFFVYFAATLSWFNNSGHLDRGFLGTPEYIRA